MESLKHRFAKEAVARWCRDGFGFFPHNRPTEVIVEYPICVDADGRLWGIDAPWAAHDEPGPWTYDRCIEHQLLPLVIFDVMVLHDGLPTLAVEIVCTNDLTDTKRKYIERVMQSPNGPVHVLKYDADEVLSQWKKQPTTCDVSVLEHIKHKSRS